MIKLVEAIVSLIFGIAIVIVNACTSPDLTVIVLGALLALTGVFGLIMYKQDEAAAYEAADELADLRVKLATAEDKIKSLEAAAATAAETAPAKAKATKPAKSKKAATATVTEEVK